MKTIRIGRSAISGRFKSVKSAKAPSQRRTSIVQTIRIGKPPKKR